MNMSIKTYEGIVENGRIRLSPDVHLPEEARVYVIFPDGQTSAFMRSPRLVNREDAKHFEMQVLSGNVNEKL
jgi:hypothetical protein